MQRLRFKADDGSQFSDWEEKTVGDMTVELQDYEPLGSGYPLMTSSRTGASVGKSYLYDKKDGKLYYAGFLIKANVISVNASESNS